MNALLTGNKALEVENKREKGRADQRFLEALKNLGGIFKTSGKAGGDKPGFLSGLKIPGLMGLGTLLGFFGKLGGILLKAPFKTISLILCHPLGVSFSNGQRKLPAALLINIFILPK